MTGIQQTTRRPAAASSPPTTPNSAPARSTTRTPSPRSSSPPSARRSSSATGCASGGSSGCRARAPTSPATYPGGLASIVITRDLDDNVYAFHNVCAHRGNKVVWQEHPARGVVGHLPRVLLQVPRLAVRPGRQGQPHHQRGRVLRPRQEHAADAAGALRGVGGLHLRQPRRGPGAAAHLPRRRAARDRGLPVPSDDAALRVLHPDQRATGSWPSTRYASGTTRRTCTAASSTPTSSKAEKMVPPVDAYHYDLFRPHMLTSVPGPPPLPPREPGTAGTRPPGPALGLQAVPRRAVRSRRRPRYRPRCPTS